MSRSVSASAAVCWEDLPGKRGRPLRPPGWSARQRGGGQRPQFKISSLKAEQPHLQRGKKEEKN